MTTPQTQCENALDDKVDPGITTCYICGLTIDKDDGSTTGRECEHVLTASTIAMLCGLEGGKKADPYTDKAEALIDEMENNDSTNTKYRTFYSDYKAFQSDLRKDVYDWSHPRCNKIKKDHPYLKIDFKPSGITIYDPSETEDNIKILPIICYEIIFDKIFKNINNKKIDILINITNDLWFGDKNAFLYVIK